MTPEELIAFEEDIAQEFNAGKIKAPVHLYSGGEHELIEIFKDIKPHDWVLCSWRSHYQCLLKGVPPAELKEKIMQGSSIALNFPKYKIVSSAIIGGILPIAVGLGMAIKRGCLGEDPTTRVHAFLGDMTALTGIAHECVQYAANFNLPVSFYIEDNGLSVMTPTRIAWGLSLEDPFPAGPYNVKYFKYDAIKYPHAGAGQRVQF